MNFTAAIQLARAAGYQTYLRFERRSAGKDSF
jgi:hypothetical protein